MPLPALTLWADSNKGEFVSGWQVNSVLGPLKLRQGDTIGIELHWVEQGSGRLMKEVAWPPAANITFAVGRIDSAPTAGVFRLAYGPNATTEIAFGALAASIQSALNALPGIIAEGGVTVIKNTTTIRITWNTPCVPAYDITVYENDLTPTSSIGIGTARPGSLTAAQITQIHIKQAPVAVATNWVNQDPPVVTVTETHAPAYSGDYRVWRIAILPEPKAGTFRLSKTVNGQTLWTAPINIEGLSASSISVATGMTVEAVDDFEFEISQSQIQSDTLVNVTVMGADYAGLIAYSSKFGELSMNALDVELLLAGAASATAYVEIEVELNGKRQTLVQNTATVYNDLIDTDSYTLVEWGDVIPADSVVRYDTQQSLTSNEQLQARTNIGAVGLPNFVPFTNKDVELESRITSLEGDMPSPDALAAIAGADAPSASNVFLTEAGASGLAPAVHTHLITDITDLAATLAGKADLSHTHIIADIDGLATLLAGIDQKANITHTHSVSEIVGLVSALAAKADDSDLANKADINHTHVGLLSQDAEDSITNTPYYSATGANPVITRGYYYYGPHALTFFTSSGPLNAGNLTTSEYGLVIKLRQGGQIYRVPAVWEGYDPYPPIPNPNG
jgi:hypothetical protein